MARTPRRHRRTPATISSPGSIAAWLALLVTVATLCLTLLGYGHDLAYLDAVGLRPEELQRSPLDFLMRSWRPLVHWLAIVNQFNGLEFHQAFWTTMWRKTWWLLLLLPLLTAFLAYCVANKPWRQFPMPGWLDWPKYLKRVPVYLQSQHTKFIARWSKWHTDPLRRWGYAGWLVWPVCIGVTVFSLVFIYFVVGFGTLVVAFIPLKGMASGTAAAQQEVLSPIGCVGHTLKPTDDTQRQARCVRIKRDGHELARGYLVDYGAGRVFLYQPCTGQPISLSLDGASIEQIKSLEFASPGKNCRTNLVAP